MPKLKTTAIIVDDEPDAIHQLEKLLGAYNSVQILETFTNTGKALGCIIKHQPDLLFLDVQMPGQDGIDFLKNLQQLDKPPTVIMVTAYQDYMLESFRNNAFDYLLKPIERTELQKTLHRFETEKPRQNIKNLLTELNNKIRIPGVYETWFLAPSQIFYLQGDGKYTDIFLTDNTRIKTSMHLKKIDEMLPEGFKRISKSNIINIAYIERIDQRTKKCRLKATENKIELIYSNQFIRNFI